MIREIPIIMPGIRPAMKSSVTEVPVDTPKMTIGIEGGIITPIAPAVATKDKQNPLL